MKTKIDYSDSLSLRKLTINQLHTIFCELAKDTPFEIVAEGYNKDGLPKRKTPYLVFIANLTTHDYKD
jgi:hypothetical protein